MLPSREILTNPREAYTKLLLAAVPSARSRGYRLSSVERVAQYRLARQLRETVLPELSGPESARASARVQ